MPEPGSEAADLLQREEPRSCAHAAQTVGRAGVSGVALLEDRAVDPDPEVRELAIRLLGENQSADVEDVLFSALSDERAEVVLAAAETLAERGAARAADAITECFTARPELEGPLALALARLGDPGVEELLWVALDDASPVERASLLRAVGACGGPRSVASLLPLIAASSGDSLVAPLVALAEIRERAPDLLEDRSLPAHAAGALAELHRSTDVRLRRAGIAIASRLASEEALVCLLDRVSDPDPGTANRALTALPGAASGREDLLMSLLVARSAEVAIAVMDRIGTLAGESARAALLPLFERPEPRVREAAAALAGRSRLGGLAPVLVRLLSDGDGHVRARAAHALGSLGESSAAQHVAKLLLDPYPDVRESALGVLRALPAALPAPAHGEPLPPGPRAAMIRAVDLRLHPELLDAGLGDRDPEVRLAALANLAERGVWSESASALLLDEDPRVRAHAVRARLLARPARPLEPLRPLVHDTDPGVRQALAAGLATLPAPAALAWLCEMCRDPGAGVSLAAVRGLARHRVPESVHALLDALSTASLPVRRGAIEALAKIGDPEALPRLRAVARGGETPLRDLAAAAARRIDRGRR